MIIGILVALAMAGWTIHIAWRKNLNIPAYALLGLLLPIVGVIVAAAEPPRRCSACPHCRARGAA